MEIEFRVLANKNTKARQMATAVFMAFGSGIWFLEPHIYEFLGETSNFVWRQVLLPPQKQKKKAVYPSCPGVSIQFTTILEGQLN